jgi:hypothetical protein
VAVVVVVVVFLRDVLAGEVAIGPISEHVDKPRGQGPTLKPCREDGRILHVIDSRGVVPFSQHFLFRRDRSGPTEVGQGLGVRQRLSHVLKELVVKA